MKKIIKKLFFKIAICCFLFCISCFNVQAASRGWVHQGKNYRYKVNGKYIKNTVYKIGKKYYFFDKKGKRKTGWKNFKKKKYYFDERKGWAYTGKKRINNKWYVFNKKGQLVNKKGFYKVGKNKYFITSHGNLANGGVFHVGKTGYLFNERACLVSKNGWYTINGKKYFVKNGHPVTGWKSINGKKKHFNNKYSYMDIGITNIGGKYYYFDSDGNIKTGLVQINHDKYYLSNDGEVQYGFVVLKNSKYYFAPNGKLVRNSYFTVNGGRYYADNSGRLKRNTWYNGQYFDNSGKVIEDAVSYDSDNVQGEIEKKDLDSMQLNSCTKLMIVAHPDDDNLWGGAHLSEGGYLVVSLTHGKDSIRSKEFYNAIKASGNIPLMLSYPDQVDGKRSNWSVERYQIAKDLDTLLQYKHWGMVVTHNPSGEYGHIQHRLTSKLVTERFYRNYWGNYLYYFGKYYNKKDLYKIENTLRKLPETAVEKKKYYLSLYTSQQRAINDSIHMAEYENWIRANEW